MVCVHHLNLHIILDFKDYFCGKDNSVIIGSADSLDYPVLVNETDSQQGYSYRTMRISLNKKILLAFCGYPLNLSHMAKPNLHLIGLFHTETTKEYSHCAFTGKVLRFPRMMKMAGYETILYGNGESETEAAETVQILTSEDLNFYKRCWLKATATVSKALTGDNLHIAKTVLAAELAKKKEAVSGEESFHGDTAAIGSPHHTAFQAKLIVELSKRVRPGDIICHPFGRSHADLLKIFPTKQYAHVETGIGYPDAPFGAFRIFETYNWQSWHHGKHGTAHNDYESVIPNYFDLNDWNVRSGPNHDGKLLYFGRICPEKGLGVVAALAEALKEEIHIIGQGDPKPWQNASKWITALPPVTGDARDALLSSYRALLMPTRFHEPFGGAGVEGMLVGTPLLASDSAAFAETIVDGKTGFRCKTLEDWVLAAEDCKWINRESVALITRSQYSLEKCSNLYGKAFTDIHRLYTTQTGWYTL